MHREPLEDVLMGLTGKIVLDPVSLEC